MCSSDLTVIYKTDVFKGEDTYRLTFDDGTTATVGHDHNWVAIKTGRSHRGENIYTTSEMYEYIQKYGKGFRIPKNKCVDYSEKDLLIDPYLLGYWLGDGCHSNNHITCHKDDFYVLEEFGHNQIKEKGNTFDFGVPNLRKKLMNIGVLNNKHIPEIYKRGSKAQRLALI